MGKRHKFLYEYNIKQIIENKTVDVDTTKWVDITPDGLSRFINITLPNWQRLLLIKTTTVIDPEKKEGSNVVGKKESHLKISRTNSLDVRNIKVDADLTKDGVIPAHIYDFFGNKNAR